MRTVKRDVEQQAYKKGYNAGLRGRAKERCPYQQNLDHRGQWMAGWRHGHSDYVVGYRRLH
jgi:ribosome modulation factor